MAARILGFALSLLSAVAIARAIGPEGKGILAVATAVPGLLAIVLGLGLGTSATIGLRERWLSARAVLRLLVGYALASGVAGAAGGLLYAEMTGEGYPPYAVIAGASIGGLLLADYAGGILQGNGRVALGMWLRQAVGIGQSTAAVGCVALGVTDPFLILSAMAGWAWLCGAGGVVAAGGFGRRGDVVERVLAPWVARIWRVGIRVQAIWILLMLNYRLDMVLLGTLGSLRDVGVYSVAVGFSEVAWFGANAIVAVLLPHLAGAEPEQVARRTRGALWLATGSTVAFAALCLVGLAFFVDAVFGRSFGDATLAFAALIPGLVAMAGFKVYAIHQIASGTPRAATLLAAGGIIVNVALNAVLIPPYGSIGAAIASSVSYTAISVVGVGALLHATRARQVGRALTEPWSRGGAEELPSER